MKNLVKINQISYINMGTDIPSVSRGGPKMEMGWKMCESFRAGALHQVSWLRPYMQYYAWLQAGKDLGRGTCPHSPARD